MNLSKISTSYFAKLQKQKPLIYHITNHVVMNFTANCLLAIGASPIISFAQEEAEELTKKSKALVINQGTLDKTWIQSAKQAMQTAKQNHVPVVFDPVGAGATHFRTQTAKMLVHEHTPTIIRGNASEILALGGKIMTTKGVDSLAAPQQALSTAQRLSFDYGSVVCISGPTDFIVFQNQIKQVSYGHPMMTQVTGMGCAASALIAAFVSVSSSAFEASYYAMQLMGISGELAASSMKGPGSFQIAFLDALFFLSHKKQKSQSI